MRGLPEGAHAGTAAQEQPNVARAARGGERGMMRSEQQQAERFAQMRRRVKQAKINAARERGESPMNYEGEFRRVRLSLRETEALAQRGSAHEVVAE